MPAWARPAAFWALAKPDVTLLVVLTTGLGFCAGSRGPLDYFALLRVVSATLLLSAGTAAMNQYFERHVDAQMRRTMARPLPSAVLTPREALVFAVSLAVCGEAWLFFFVNPLAALLGACSCITYLALYTPLKSRTPWCTFVGAFPGAVPPLIGWAAARNSSAVPRGSSSRFFSSGNSRISSRLPGSTARITPAPASACFRSWILLGAPRFATLWATRPSWFPSVCFPRSRDWPVCVICLGPCCWAWRSCK